VGRECRGQARRRAEPLKPQVVAFVDDEAGPDVAQKVQRRLQHFIDRKIATLFEPLLAMGRDEALSGLARGFAFRLVENLGIIPRESIAQEVKELDQDARGALRKHGVRFGQFTVFLPLILKPAPTRLRLVLWALAGGLDEFPESPPPGLVTVPAARDVPDGYHTMAGYRAAGDRAIRIDMLERLADMLRQENSRAGFEAKADMLSITGLSLEQFAGLMEGLGYRSERGERPKLRVAPPPVPEPDLALPPEAAEEGTPEVVAVPAEPGEDATADADALTGESAPENDRAPPEAAPAGEAPSVEPAAPERAPDVEPEAAATLPTAEAVAEGADVGRRRRRRWRRKCSTRSPGAAGVAGANRASGAGAPGLRARRFRGNAQPGPCLSATGRGRDGARRTGARRAGRRARVRRATVRPARRRRGPSSRGPTGKAGSTPTIPSPPRSWASGRRTDAAGGPPDPEARQVALAGALLQDADARRGNGRKREGPGERPYRQEALCAVGPGDVLTVVQGDRVRVVRVLGLPGRRGLPSRRRRSTKSRRRKVSLQVDTSASAQMKVAPSA
jgi:ATP-dependent RNA helicase SUPV3L1/SUV3